MVKTEIKQKSKENIKMRKFFVTLILLASFFSNVAMSASSSSCDNYSNNVCSYSSSDAVSYARNYALSDTDFPKYQELGGNCTNFVSQSVLAGLIGSSDKKTVFNKRIYYWADKDRSCDYCWYYGKYDDDQAKWTKGTAWTGAHEMFEYANSNLDSYWGDAFWFYNKR